VAESRPVPASASGTLEGPGHLPVAVRRRRVHRRARGRAARRRGPQGVRRGGEPDVGIADRTEHGARVRGDRIRGRVFRGDQHRVRRGGLAAARAVPVPGSAPPEPAGRPAAVGLADRRRARARVRLRAQRLVRPGAGGGGIPGDLRLSRHRARHRVRVAAARRARDRAGARRGRHRAGAGGVHPRRRAVPDVPAHHAAVDQVGGRCTAWCSRSPGASASSAPSRSSRPAAWREARRPSRRWSSSGTASSTS
jgi:hypothetical protein